MLGPVSPGLTPGKDQGRDMNSLGTLRNYDGDGNGNVKKVIGLVSKTTTLHVHHAFCTFLCRPCITRTWNDRILSLLGNGNGKAINSTISFRTRPPSLLFSFTSNSLLLSNWAPWNNREKKVKGCEVHFSATFSWTSPLLDRKVPNNSLPGADRKFVTSIVTRDGKIPLWGSGTPAPLLNQSTV